MTDDYIRLPVMVSRREFEANQSPEDFAIFKKALARAVVGTVIDLARERGWIRDMAETRWLDDSDE